MSIYQIELEKAKRKKQRHFCFGYLVSEMAKAKRAPDAMVGSELAKLAWISNQFGWWSAVISVFSSNDDGTTTEVKAYCKPDTMRSPHGLTADLHEAIERLHAEHPDVLMDHSSVTITYSLVRPKGAV